MKKLIIAASLCAALCSVGSVIKYDLRCGTNDVDSVKLRGSSAQLVGFETIMTDASETGTASLSIGRTAVANLKHTDYVTHSTTSVVSEVDTLVNDYDVTATFTADGANMWVQNSIFSNCYANTTKTGTYASTNKTSRIVFRPGNGNKTLVPPTDFYVGLTFFEDNRWSTNFVWEAGQSEIGLSSGAGNPSYIVTVRRRQMPKTQVKIVTNAVTTVTTNVWNEKVSRMAVIPVIQNAALANGYAMSAPTNSTYVFAGDKIICDAPIATNKPGVVRAILVQ